MNTDIVSDAVTQRINSFFDEHTPPTPCLVVDLDVVADHYRSLCSALPDTQMFYAVKANDHPYVIRRLVELGASFDVASPAEIDRCLEAGAAPQSLSYGNTVKKVEDIRYAYQVGVDRFVFDRAEELQKISASAPGASVFCRIQADSDGARWGLSGKFGCSAQTAVDLLKEARTLGLHPYGLSFHLGSQQLDPDRYGDGIGAGARIFAELAQCGIELEMLNIGGGFPARYAEEVPSIRRYGEAIREALDASFGSSARPMIAAEPGRYITGDAGVLRTQVIGVSETPLDGEERWVYLDIGRFGGLAETEGEAIQYRLDSGHDGEPCGPVVLAGPTCDSADVLYREADYRLPLALATGDHVDLLSAGAYTATYSSVGFNGIPPLSTYCIGG